MLKVFRTVIVYSLRNVGKSELVRYWLRRGDVNAVIIYARLLRDRDLSRRLGISCLGANAVSELARDVVKEVLESIEGMGVLSLVASITERILNTLRSLRKPLYVFIDEYHLLPRYKSTLAPSRLEEALEDLEALAALLAKDPRYEGARLILTVSEGFIATRLARQKLLGYSAAWLLVEPMDLNHFAELYREYR